MTESARADTDRLNEETPRRAWAILAVTYFASICAPLAQFKIPPLADWLFANFAPVGLDGATFGMLMSSMAIIGCILAFPAAFVARKMGLKGTVIFSLVCLAVGSAMGALANSIALLLVSRLIEGIGIGLIGVAAPTCVSIWFPPRRRGLALGLWATWVPLGCVIIMNVAPAMAGGNPGVSLTGYTTVFWFCAIMSIVALVLFAAVFKLPEGESGDMGVEGSFKDSLPYLKNKYIWFLGIVFFTLCMCTLAIVNTYYQQFLIAQPPVGMGFSNQLAGSVTSIMMAFSLFFAPLAGGLSDRLAPNKKRWIAFGAALALLIAVPFGFRGGDGSIACLVIFVIIQGAAGAFVAGGCRPMAPMIMGGTAMGATMGMAVLQFCQNLGQAIGSPVFGALMDAFGGGFFIPSLIVQIPMLVIGAIAAFVIKPFPEESVPEELR